jgi:cellulose synthase/poly-beta-1,6-N-acetylglucosamine synthase-like glycosyltransferase
MPAPLTSAAILVCTRDRHPSLQRALTSLEALQIPPDLQVRIRLVDNGSRQPVADWLGSRGWARPELPVEVVVEPRAGKSAALNRGLRDLDVDLVAFTDDDMEFHPGWLRAAVARLREDPHQGLQGHIEIRSDQPLPPWFTPRCARLFGGTVGLADRAGLAGLAGGNSFVPRALIEKAGPFCEDLGPQGKRLGYSEDMEWSGRLQAAGVPLRYCREAVNYHVVGADRLRRRVLLRRQFDYTRTEALLDGRLPAGSRRWEDGVLPAQARGLLGAILKPQARFAGLDYGLELAGRLGLVWGLVLRRLGLGR